ncbi:type I-E CRISPR-associated protein Cse1/CasA [Aromatoleum diolicum]|uniref:Type I-E CRISPR-associated protein Cse1/CasA n=1 Tax=Aromatoleum diolicum TaxID=75796 RepID=A0ABX1QBC8_9RHOO|nr:type I-E CRISPR-associated protein Cse1/CasA [Aromatoleum diolicum]NMG75345.1 type I-E CRISPR-associated protein Cse1/CasA [Aromatoleum diolicum]
MNDNTAPLPQSAPPSDGPATSPHFNLVDEAWIPVRYLNGDSAELGIRETLLRAGQIAEIQDASPLVVAALHRFLLAVLYRALEGPTDALQAKTWFKQGWPQEKIEAYLQRWHDRFWLFDKRYPFAQVPDFTPRNWRAWTVLAAEHNADNAKVLFDHVDVNQAGAISPAHAARWLLATQTFSVSCGKSELSHTGTAPSATAVMALPLGLSLTDTLMYQLVPQNRCVLVGDIPLWEREPESANTLRSGPERAISGYADRYTWQIRAVRLQAEADFSVTRLAFASGINPLAEQQSDPMLCYRVDEKHGRLPVIFRERGFWRDFDSLLPDASNNAPLVMTHAVVLSRAFPARFPVTVMVVGQSNDKAKIEYWRMERFTLPPALVGDRDVRADVRELLVAAEGAQTALGAACKSFARNVLSRGEREPATKDVNGFLRQMPVIDRYWSSLEPRFHEILGEYTEARDPEDIRLLWLRHVLAAMSAAWRGYAASIAGSDAWAIRALARAEVPVLRQIGRLKQEISKLEPQKEPA